jgi:RNA polymerase sigma-70 factor, ECF subfamily
MTASPRSKLRLVPTTPEPPAELKGGPAYDDLGLLAGLKRRDPAVAAAFYDRVRPIVDRTLSRLLGPGDQDYEDLAQTALFELVSTIGRFRGECPLDAWLSVVTARVVYKKIRRRQLERRVFAVTPLDDSALPTRGHSTPLLTRQAIARVQRHLGKMDRRRAWTFLLHDVYGYDLKEIGTITGASLSAAQSRLVRGRRELHDRIRGDVELAHFFDDLSEDVP